MTLTKRRVPLNSLFSLLLFPWHSLVAEAWITSSPSLNAFSTQHFVSGRHQRNNLACKCQNPAVGGATLKMTAGSSGEESRLASLADQYMIEISSSTMWSLFRIEQVVDGMYIADGVKATEALACPIPASLSPAANLECIATEDSGLLVTVNNYEGVSADLIKVLIRILVQWAATHSESSPDWKVGLGEGNDVAITDMTSEPELQKLFADLVDTSTFIEWVEMVTGTGQILGCVPRRLVHSFNLLHRGIGLFVTKDEPLDVKAEVFPDLYVHRRTDIKRIFPSLYDMFVGGISLAGEDAETTARREVAEELGLTRALEDANALSKPILDCVVCTAYNRCVVTLFSYTMNSEQETVTWQEEEVAWGDFVPYSIITSAADRSILRFAAAKKWPGKYPPIQSELKGSEPEGGSYESGAWMTWDFVPDGLLVWEAWLAGLRE
jgi:8-oxo-dGTP pyrophosphatase MutT (NUDIX family)